MRFFYKCKTCPPHGIYRPGITYRFIAISGYFVGRDHWDQQYSFTLQQLQTYFEDVSYNSNQYFDPNSGAAMGPVLHSGPLPISSPLLGGPPNSTIKDPDIKAPQMQTEIVAEYVAERTPYDDYMERFCLDEY